MQVRSRFGPRKTLVFLIDVLDQQDLTTRYRALYALDFGLGSLDSVERQQFESVINKQDSNNLTALAWRDISGNSETK